MRCTFAFAACARAECRLLSTQHHPVHSLFPLLVVARPDVLGAKGRVWRFPEGSQAGTGTCVTLCVRRARSLSLGPEDTWGFIVGGPWSPQDLANQVKKCAGPEARRVASALHDGVHSGMIESTLSNFVHSLPW